MQDEVFMAGLGGQGVLLAGHVLAQAALDSGFEVSWYPSYSPEVRGGEAMCTVVVSDQPVRSPIVGRPRAMLLMSPSAALTHSPACAVGGLIVVNTSLGPIQIRRDDVRVVGVAANGLAREAGSDQVANMVMLGAYLALRHPQLLHAVEQALRSVLPERHHRFIPVNTKAIELGRQAVAVRGECP